MVPQLKFDGQWSDVITFSRVHPALADPGNNRMQNQPERLIIASRESRLAMWQAEHVRAALQQLYPRCQVSILGMTTRGDQILDRALSKVGGKGLFIKELEAALIEGRADLAVHSMKDVPVDLAPDFTLAATMTREDPRDAFVSNHHADLASLPPGAVVGTSSLRREAQIRRRHPHLVVQPLRGNLDTRLRKLDAGDYAAIVLAAAGLKRLGMAERIRAILPPSESLPAAGQGALAIEVMAHRKDMIEWLRPFDHAETSACVRAERAISRALGGSCTVPLAAYAEIDAGRLRLRARVASPDGTQYVESDALGAIEDADAMAAAASNDLLARGADRILAALKPAP
jgi:hydroxymethylbilane synthase